jgi:retron-type reverse transcriptase
MTVAQLPVRLRQHWPAIREQLLSGTCQPQPVKRVEMPKPDGAVRKLGIPTVLDRFIQQAAMQDGLVSATDEGTPQGGPLSPLLSNLVLDELDRELPQRGHKFVRDADDGNLCVRSERAGRRV